MPVYSHSRLGVFRNCPLQYKFMYIDRVERAEEGIEAFLGSRFHEVMEKLYKTARFKVPALEELLAFYENQWEKEYTGDIIIVKKELAADDYRKTGRKYIEDYYKRYYPFHAERVLGTEKAVTIDLNNDGKYLLRGFVDRIDLAGDGLYEIHDYKTSTTLPEQRYMDEDPQLALYQMAVERMWSDVKSVKLIWHYVAFDKELVSTRTPEQQEKLKQDLICLIDRIAATREFGPIESALCEWCSYGDLCPRKKHLFKVDMAKQNPYFSDDGMKLVGTFTDLALRRRELVKQAKEIDEEMGKVKEAVIKYAASEGVDVVYGEANKLKISSKQKVSIPAKDDPARSELEKIIKELNKWEEVSDINVTSLEKIVNDNLWGKDLLDKISKYLEITPLKTVSLSKRNDSNSKQN